MAKLICIDIDGTLVTKDQKVPESAQRAIREAKENGNKLLLCTGRAMPEIHPDFWKLGFSGAISAAGAHVRIGDLVLIDERIEKEEILRITRLYQEKGATWMWQAPQEFCPGPRFFEVFTGAKDAVGTPWEKYAEYVKLFLRETTPESVSKGIFLFPGGTIDDVENFAEAVGERYRVIPGTVAAECGYGGEIILSGVNKATGLKAAAEHMGIAMKNTVAIGDSLNDYEVVEAAGFGIAMGNAHPRLKAIADYVTDDVEHDGLAKALQRLAPEN